MRPGSRITIVLADRQQLVREGVRLLLESEPDLRVLGEASTLAHALELVGTFRPDVLVACPDGGSSAGLELARQALERSPGVRVVLLSMYDSSDRVARALRSGASGYVLKDSSAAGLVRAVRRVAAGGRSLSPPLVESEIEGLLGRGRSRPGSGILTPRQAQVLRLAAEGLTSAAIGRRLRISPRTVEVHRANVIRRLGLRSRTDLIRYALQHGILPLRGDGRRTVKRRGQARVAR